MTLIENDKDEDHIQIRLIKFVKLKRDWTDVNQINQKYNLIILDKELVYEC